MNTLAHFNGLDQNLDDIRRKFLSTYFEATIKKETQVVCLADTDGPEWAYLRMKPGAPLVKVLTKDVEIVRDFPNVGWINFNKGVMFIQRNPARQWQVGMCRANASVWDHGNTTVDTTHSIAVAAFGYQKPASIKEALELIRKRKHTGVALNRNYALINNATAISLYRKRMPIASFEQSKFFFNHNCTWFKPEIETDFQGEYHEFFKK